MSALWALRYEFEWIHQWKNWLKLKNFICLKSSRSSSRSSTFSGSGSSRSRSRSSISSFSSHSSQHSSFSGSRSRQDITNRIKIGKLLSDEINVSAILLYWSLKSFIWHCQALAWNINIHVIGGVCFLLLITLFFISPDPNLSLRLPPHPCQHRKILLRTK